MTVLVRKCIVSLSTLTPTRHHNYSFPFQTLLFSSSANVSVPTAEYLTTQHHISPETALKVSSTISHIKKPLRTDSMLSWFNQTGFSLPQIDHMINKLPPILNVNPEIVKQKLRMFFDKGFSTTDTILIVSKYPGVLHRSSENRLVSSIDALKATLGSNYSVCRVLKSYPWILDRDLGKTMTPIVEFLKKHFELNSSQVAHFMIQYPKFFTLQPRTIEDGVRRVDKMGLKFSSKMYFYAVRVVCSLSEEKLKLKMKFFQGLGMSDHDVLQILQACPHVFGCSEKNINEKMEVLLGSGRADSSLPLKLVVLLSFSLEKRIKPRLEVVKALEERGLLSKKLGLASILHMTNSKFLERFVISNSNALGDDCVIGITKKLALHSGI